MGIHFISFNYVSSCGEYRSCNVCLILFLSLSNQATYKNNEIVGLHRRVSHDMFLFLPFGN